MQLYPELILRVACRCSSNMGSQIGPFHFHFWPCQVKPCRGHLRFHYQFKLCQAKMEHLRLRAKAYPIRLQAGCPDHLTVCTSCSVCIHSERAIQVTLSQTTETLLAPKASATSLSIVVMPVYASYICFVSGKARLSSFYSSSIK